MNLVSYKQEFLTNYKIAYPIVLGQVAHLLVALADNVMVGKLGDAPLAAVSLGNTLIYIALSIGIGFSFAITPLVSTAQGQENWTKVKRILDNGVFLSFIMGILLTALLIVAEPLLFYMDQPAEVVELAIPYMHIVSISMVPLMLFQAFKQFSDGLSLTKHAMNAAVIANVINVMLNYLLIYGEFGFPKLGLVGAAWGTLVSRIIMVIIIYISLSRKPSLYQQFKGPIFISMTNITKILSLGFPTALQMLFEVSLFTGAIFLSGMLGTKHQAANQIALNLSALTFMFGIGLGVTATIRVGNQLGKRNFSYMKQIVKSLFFMVLVIEILFMCLFFIGRNYLPWIYINDTEVIQIASHLLLIAAIFQVSDGIQVFLLGLLRGLHDVWYPSLFCFISYWCIGFPLAYYLGFQTYLSSMGIWVALLIALTSSATMMFFRYKYLVRRISM
ncbi:MATE family efflux transporter [Nonlabens tegetincola]|uniref:MATE family efflux transporter n=1 Tax=Nonlabens tegetincola TaxID=323273 RepID=UPI000A202718|nr:MATE family efflux transporter [Nonlabens tegetincola]ARN72532.1 MATE family efflux transporter [Nonlabens tegetincola]